MKSRVLKHAVCIPVLMGRLMGQLLIAPMVIVLGGGLAMADPWAEVEVEQYGTATVNIDHFPQHAGYEPQDDLMGNVDLRPQMVVLGDEYELVLEPRVVIPQRGAAYVDLKEAFINTSFGDVDVLIGNTTVFWGKTEAINLVDIINTKDYGRGLQTGEKQGMPMLRLMTTLGPGDAELYVMPHFVENRYADERSRHRTALPIKENTTQYSAGDDKNDPAMAVRYSGYIGDLDYGVSYFNGTTRDPGFFVDGFTALIPVYHAITQTGLDAQWIRGDTSFKIEAIRRTNQLNASAVAEDYNAAIIGVEHNLFGVFGGNADLTLFTEYARDTRQADAGSGFQDDVFAGGIISMNDVNDTQWRVIGSYDRDYSSKSITAEYERRIVDNINLDASFYAPSGMDDDAQFASFKRDMRLHLGLKYSW